MPNWCCNELYIIGSKTDLNKLEKFVKRGDNYLSFRKIIPPPDARILDTSEGFNGKIEGLPDGYHWSVEKWGTKWDASGVDRVLVDAAELGVYYEDVKDMMCLKYTFDTAWSPPVPILEALVKKYPSLEFHMHCEEAGMGFVADYDSTEDGNIVSKVRDASWYDYNIHKIRGG